MLPLPRVNVPRGLHTVVHKLDIDSYPDPFHRRRHFGPVAKVMTRTSAARGLAGVAAAFHRLPE